MCARIADVLEGKETSLGKHSNHVAWRLRSCVCVEEDGKNYREFIEASRYRGNASIIILQIIAID